MGQVSAIEEIRYVVRKQERELDDMRAKMRDNVSERHCVVERPFCCLMSKFDIFHAAANHRGQAIQPGGLLERQVQVTDAGARGRDGEGQGGGELDEVVRRECQERTGEGNGSPAKSKDVNDLLGLTDFQYPLYGIPSPSARDLESDL